jgi:YD repeat-containing protein
MFDPSRRLRSGAKTCRESHWVPVGRVASCCAVVCLLMSVTSAQADDVTYGYDALGRLTSVTVAGATAYYDYDAAGNITAIRRQGVASSMSPVNDVGPSPVSDAGKSASSRALTQASAR